MALIDIKSKNKDIHMYSTVHVLYIKINAQK